MCRCSLIHPPNVSLLARAHTLTHSRAAASLPSCPVRCSSPEPPPSFTAHLCSQQGASCNSGPCIDAVQLFSNPALDFDPLPFKRALPKETSHLVVICGHLII